jgi:hypothetical protein
MVQKALGVLLIRHTNLLKPMEHSVGQCFHWSNFNLSPLPSRRMDPGQSPV